MEIQWIDLLRRSVPPAPWEEGDKIPWNDPDFSRRMLREHLSQAHDAASRRTEMVDRHVAWLAGLLPAGRPGRVLDLACGPGLYAHRLAGRGHSVRGIDFGPASIDYAREKAAAEGLGTVEYELEDIREADYGGPHDLAMLIYGEFNVFRQADARRILQKADAALAPGGLLVLEPHTEQAVRELGEAGTGWSTTESGLFSERPYLCLTESFWNEPQRAAVTRHYIVDLESKTMARHSESMQAYSDDAYRAMLVDYGFGEIAFGPSLTGEDSGAKEGLFVITARKQVD